MEPESPPTPAPLSGTDLRRRAAAGLAAVGLRQLAIRALGLGGTIVLARLLLPADFGAVAVGTTLTMVFGFVGDAGIGAGLIRGPKAPDRLDLASVLGFQLLLMTVLAAGTIAVGVRLGHVGQVTAVIAASLPLASLRVPAAIVFERELRYPTLVVVELLETVVYYAWAIVTVLLGWGVWGLASAAIVRSGVGAVAINLLSPTGFILPRLAWGRVRPLIAFGLQYQAVNAVGLVRDQGLNAGTALIGGIPVLGFWTLAYRILQVPFLLFDTLWRVSFPAMARLIAAGEEPQPIMERGLALSSLITGAMLAVLVGSTPALIPFVFGHQWSPVIPVIPWSSLGLMFGGPVSVATAGYLYAQGDSRSVLLSALLHAVTWFVLAFSLMRVLGVAALGIGWLGASVVEAFVLANRTRRHLPIRFVRHLAVPAVSAAAAALLGWLIATQLGPTFVSLLASAFAAAIAYLAVMLAVRRQLVGDAIAFGRRSAGLLAG